MAKKIEKKEKRNNNLLLILVLLVIIVSVFSTLIIMDSVEDTKKFFLSNQIATGSGQVKLTILPNPENGNFPISGGMVSGRITMGIANQR